MFGRVSLAGRATDSATEAEPSNEPPVVPDVGSCAASGPLEGCSESTVPAVANKRRSATTSTTGDPPTPMRLTPTKAPRRESVSATRFLTTRSNASNYPRQRTKLENTSPQHRRIQVAIGWLAQPPSYKCPNGWATARARALRQRRAMRRPRGPWAHDATRRGRSRPPVPCTSGRAPGDGRSARRVPSHHRRHIHRK